MKFPAYTGLAPVFCHKLIFLDFSKIRGIIQPFVVTSISLDSDAQKVALNHGRMARICPALLPISFSESVHKDLFAAKTIISFDLKGGYRK